MIFLPISPNDKGSLIMGTGILLSACLMVRDEEHNIGRCLQSLKGIVDEVVLVDTGSIDRTVEIAKEYGARVYQHPWQNDFSLHRNQSISYAKGDWILIVDADEEIVLAPGSTPNNFRTFLQRADKKYPAAAILLKDIQKGMSVMQFNTTRFFRKGTVHYEGIVHNQPQVKGCAVFAENIHVNHYGYDLTPEQKVKKFERTKGLLLKQVEKGETKDGLPYFYLCQLFAENKTPLDAVIWGEKYIEAYLKGEIQEDHFNVTIYFTMVKQYMKIGDKEKSQVWLQNGLNKLPGDLDMAMAALEYGIWTNDYFLQVSAAKDFIELYKKFEENPMNKKNRFVFSLRPEALVIVYSRLAIAQLSEGSAALKEMVKYFSQVSEPFKNGVMQDLESSLKDSNVPIKFVADKKLQEEGNQNRLATLNV